MKPTAVRLLLVCVLFVGWLGYLGFLVLTRPVTAAGWPLVLSRPQILTSGIDVVAEIGDPNDEVEIVEVLWPEAAPLQPGNRVKIARVGECYPLPRRIDEVPPKDFSGPGRYLIPLRQIGPGRFEVAPIPASPGFSGISEPVRIYPATSEALAQYRQIRKPE